VFENYKILTRGHLISTLCNETQEWRIAHLEDWEISHELINKLLASENSAEADHFTGRPEDHTGWWIGNPPIFSAGRK